LVHIHYFCPYSTDSPGPAPDLIQSDGNQTRIMRLQQAAGRPKDLFDPHLL
jgi:hypothetical protein